MLIWALAVVVLGEVAVLRQLEDLEQPVFLGKDMMAVEVSTLVLGVILLEVEAEEHLKLDSLLLLLI
jgi:hypothetical protein